MKEEGWKEAVGDFCDNQQEQRGVIFKNIYNVVFTNIQLTLNHFNNAFETMPSQIKDAKENSFTAFSNTNIFSSPYFFSGIGGA